MNDIGFALNYTNIYMIDITPSSTTPTWARIGAGITDATPEGNEEVDQTGYYDGEGMATSEVTGGQRIVTFEGNRVYGDAAQDYVASIELQYGGSRKTKMRHIAPDGRTLEGDVTIANIVGAGGEANAKGDFSFEAHYNGLPTVTAGEADTYPATISGTPVTVAVGATSAVTATVTPSDASTSFVYAVDDLTKATVDAAGTVTGVAVGTTNLSIKSAVKPSVVTSVVVTVTSA